MRLALACASGVAAAAAVVTSCSAFALNHIASRPAAAGGAGTGAAASYSSSPRATDTRSAQRRSGGRRHTTSGSHDEVRRGAKSGAERSSCFTPSRVATHHHGGPWGARQQQQQRTRSLTLGMSAGGNGDGTGRLSRWVEAGKKWLVGAALASSLVGGGAVLAPDGLPAAMAASSQDTKEIGLCLLSECRGELASCLLNPKCFANIICLQTCNGRPDEGYCQIRCGDLFENEAVGKFNACAVSKKNCVKQRQDDGSWPVPPIESQAKAFNPKMMEGQWYISAGLNPAFDTFDCQVHFFNSPKPGKLVGKLNWRIKEPDGEFFTRDVVQKFQQDPENPAHLVNKDNDYLHYRDDWYVLDSEPNSFVLVVYRGSNDAWDGYGGGTLYTKDKTVPPGIVDRVKAKSEAAGIKWSRWTYNDNTCKPQTSETAELLREKYAKKLVLSEGRQLQEQLTAVRGFAAQEVSEVEQSTLEKLEDLKQEYEVEVEQLGSDLATAFETELRLFEEGLANEASTVLNEATSIITGNGNSGE
ncbi:unnamed protein product [Scytosiphon promiscuus]